MRLKQAAAVLQMHENHLKRLIKRGELNARKFGSRWNIEQSDIDSFLESRSRKSQLVIYVIEAENLGMFKIGCSYDAGMRISALQTASPVPLKMLFTAPAHCESVEYALHHRFRDKRRHGEWFALTREDLETARALLTAEDGVLRAAVHLAVGWEKTEKDLAYHLRRLVGAERADEILGQWKKSTGRAA